MVHQRGPICSRHGRLTEMRMVPKRSCLIWGGKLIQKRFIRSDRALGDTNRTVRPTTSVLEQAMPMLIDQRYWISCLKKTTYNAGARLHRRVCQLIDHIQIERVALTSWLSHEHVGQMR